MALNAPLRVVAIGGGTGLSALLHGLKLSATPIDITAVVTVTDDGGSSGRLRRDFDILPPGDIRNCMAALSEDEALLSRLFQYRFAGGAGLKGHSFGNLFLTALTHISGDFALAVKQSSEVLKIKGRIFPSTRANVQLEALLEDGTTIRGETRISQSSRPIMRLRLHPGHCKPLKETLEAIATADVITFGPGSLFTSVIPNVLVAGIPKAIRASPATKAYFVNIMWQPGETVDFRASDHISAIHKHAGGSLIDTAILNSSPIRPELRRRYAREKVEPVLNDIENIRALGIRVVSAPLLEETDVIRHDSMAAARIVFRLARASRRRQIKGEA